MAKSGWMSWLTSPAIVGAAVLVSALPVAAEDAMSQEGQRAVDGPAGEAVREVSSPLDLNPGDTVPPAPVSNLEAESADSDPMAQVTSVSQLSDVQPTDWAFQALQNLVERYGCIAGYPDGTFRGNRAMTRYEFAAGLNACLERITQLISRVDTSNLATKQDLATRSPAAGGISGGTGYAAGAHRCPRSANGGTGSEPIFHHD